MAVALQTKKYDVGGVLLDRPFKIRRLGHFGYNTTHLEESVRFYTELLGFRKSDDLGINPNGPPMGCFMRYGTDHHAFVLIRENAGMRERFPEVTVNQITWQVGSLGEIVGAASWLSEQGVTLQRTGRDMPGSNWHTYFYDPDGHVNELYYGMEQIGWTGESKPQPMYNRRFREAPSLPQMSEDDEITQAQGNGVNVHSGFRTPLETDGKFDVDGVMLARPFRIVRIGPVRLFVHDVPVAEAFYRDIMGFVTTEEVTWHGHRCVLLRGNTEHHALGLYPVELRSELGMRSDSSCMSFGVQLATYRQLRDAVSWLKDKGCQVRELPPELFPGMAHSAFVTDPDGHAVQLYAYMEQIGWDGQPRPAHLRPQIRTGDWPETVEAASDTYGGEPFLGPWG